MMVGLTSAAGLIGFLAEPDPDLRVFALNRLNDEIELLWPEVAGSVGQMWAKPDFSDGHLALYLFSFQGYCYAVTDRVRLFQRSTLRRRIFSGSGARRAGCRQSLLSPSGVQREHGIRVRSWEAARYRSRWGVRRYNNW